MPELTRAQFALMLHSVPRLGQKGIARLLSQVPPGPPDQRFDLSQIAFWNLDATALASQFRLYRDAAELIANRKNDLLKLALDASAAVERLNINVMTSLDPDYPASLRECYSLPPPIVYSYGNLGLLRERKFAVVSSTDTRPANIHIIRQLAGVLADEGLCTVTSHNTRAYRTVGLAAKSRKSSLMLVLDRGLLAAFSHGLEWEPVASARIWEPGFDPHRDLVISPFRLQDRWIGSNSRDRDRMVFALADVLVAVEVRLGGVMQGECLTALERGREVYVYQPSSDLPPGNGYLLEHGCTPIPSDGVCSFLSTLDLPPEDEQEE